MFFFFKQKTAYEMRISDWSSDVCSSDLHRTASPGTVHRRIACFLRHGRASPVTDAYRPGGRSGAPAAPCGSPGLGVGFKGVRRTMAGWSRHRGGRPVPEAPPVIGDGRGSRSEEHTSELQSLMRISYAVFCLKKKKQNEHITKNI